MIPMRRRTEDGRIVYSFLQDLGFRTTRGVWPGPAVREPNSRGDTCASAPYRQHASELQAAGFEIGYHHTDEALSTRDEIIRGLDLFRGYFGHDPSTMANHYNAEAIYWGPARLTPPLRTVYRLATLGRTDGAHGGESKDTRPSGATCVVRGSGTAGTSCTPTSTRSPPVRRCPITIHTGRS